MIGIDKSKEKTAFVTPRVHNISKGLPYLYYELLVTPQGLFEFCVMPFGLTTPSVFQRLMNRVLMGLNPTNGPDFVTINIDDELIFSKLLEEHPPYLKQVLQHIQDVGLTLKPEKCKFICQGVEYLGHTITPLGLQANQRLVTAVKEFSHPNNVTLS